MKTTTRILTLVIVIAGFAAISPAATVTWDGGGDGVSWHAAANWIDDRLPASTNDVVINVPTNVTVVFSNGSVTVRSVRCEGGFSLADGTLTVTSSNSQFNGPFTITNGATLVVRGAGTELTVNGPTAYSGGSLQPQQGGILRLPELRRIELTNQHLTFNVAGAGSTLDLSSVTNVALTGRILNIYATSGGKIDLSKAQITSLTADVYVDAGLLDLSAVSGSGIPSGSSLEVRNGGEIRMPGLTELTNTQLAIRGPGCRFPTDRLKAFLNGTLTVQRSTNDFSNLTNLLGSWINLELDSALVLTNVTSLSMTIGSVSFSARGPRCLLDLSGVTNVVAGYWFSLSTYNGGVINLSRAQIPDGQLTVWADGTGSLVDLSGLQNRWSESPTSTWDLHASDGGVILLPNITELNRADLSIADTGVIAFGPLHALTQSAVRVDGTTVALTNLVNTLGTTFTYQNGGQIVFPPAVDLVVPEVQGPSAVVAGQLIELSWTVRNEGTNPASGSRADAVYLSTDRAVGNDVFLGHFSSTEPLPAGATGSVTNTLIVPSSLDGTFYFIVAADSLYQFYEGAGETNNTFITTNTISISAPDLQVQSVTAPSAAQFGSTVDVTWVVKNTGSASASQVWSDRLYLTTNSSSLAGATVLRTLPARGALGPEASYTNTQPVTLPQQAGMLPGTYFILAATDWNNTQPESNEANNLGSRTVNLTLGPLPDLRVTQAIAPPTATPGQPVPLVWAAANQGTAAATGRWSEAISFFNANNSMETAAVLDFTNDLAAGDTLWRTQAVVLPLTFPAGTNQLIVRVDAWDEVFELDEDNNVLLITNLTLIPASLSLQVPLTQVEESASSPILVTLARNDHLDQPLLITLSVSDTNELSLPASVQMPAGMSIGTVELSVLRDGLVDGPKPVTITASAPGYPSAQQTVTVLDVDAPQLTLSLTSSNVLEGSSLPATVSSPFAAANALTVFLETSNPNQLSVPASVIIPAGSNSCAFQITPFDDTQIELPADYTVRAAAIGHLSAAASVTVFDNDLPAVGLSLARTSINEGDGIQATLATVVRSIVSDRALTIELANSDPTAVSVPTRVVIPANQAMATFAVAAVDDAVDRGPRTVVLTPYVLATSQNVRLAQGNSASLTVLDNDGPALRVAVMKKLVGEGLNPATTATVSRNTPATNALLVTLESSDLSEATVPPTVTIPAGQTSQTFTMASLNDATNDGNQTVILTASAPDFTPGSDIVVVTDLALPDLIVESIAGPATAATEEYVTVNCRVSNQGLATTATNFLTRIYFSSDALIGDDTLAGEFQFQGVIPPGQYFEQALQVRLPQTVGDLWLVAQTDVEQRIPEALEDNNASISAAPIQVRVAYGAYVQTSLTSAPAGTPVPLTGRATNSFGGGAPFRLVNIHLWVRGMERVISALTDSDGNFTATFQPLANEAGTYEIFATHPVVGQAAGQDTFTLLGMQADPTTASLKIIEQTSATRTVRLENLGDVPLTGLDATVLSQPNGLEVTLRLEEAGASEPAQTRSADFQSAVSQVFNLQTAVKAPAPSRLQVGDTADYKSALPASPKDGATTLPGSGALNLICTFNAGLGASAGPAQIRVTSAEGASVDITFNLTVEELRPRLVANPPSLLSGMVRGQQRAVEFEVVNQGGLATGPLTVALPLVTWLQVACTNPLPPLAPGETNRVTLLLTPDAGLPLGPYTGGLVLSSSNASLQVPFEFRALSEARGDLLVTAVDELTTFAEGAPKVVGAKVVVRDLLTRAEVGGGLTDTNGQCLFIQLPEAVYEVEVTAQKHQGNRLTGRVLPGQTNAVEAFLSYQAVQYSWSIVPVATEDRYRVSVETVFETAVPIPVVTVEPRRIDLATITNDTAQVELRISNHGLIAAQNMRLRLPTHPDWVFSTLVTNIGTLPAQSTLTLPVLIAKKSASSPASPNRSPKDGGAPGPCSAPLHVGWELECGDRKLDYSTQVTADNARPDCGSWHPLIGWCCITGDTEYGPPGPRDSGGPGVPNIYAPFEFQCSPSLCECGWWPRLCIEGSVSISPDGLANKLKDKILALVGTTTGVLVRDPEITVQAGGSLCSCCENSHVSWEGEASASASIKVTVAIGLVGEFEVPEVSGWTNLAAHAYGVIGLELKLEGSVSINASRACNGPVSLCLEGEVTLQALAGATGEVEVSAKPLQPTMVGTNAYFPDFSGKISGQFGISGNLTAKVSGCLDENGESEIGMELCGQVWFRANCSGSISATVPVAAGGGTNDVEVSASMSLNWDRKLWEAGECGEDKKRAPKDDGGGSGVTPISRSDVLLSDAALHALFGHTPLPSSGVCAHVKVRLDQDAVVSRDAFHASLTLDNSADTPLEQVQVLLTVQDAGGLDMTERFSIAPPTLEGVTAVDGSGLIAAGASGSAGWEIIPGDNAALTEPTAYFVSGHIRYVQEGEATTIPITPTRIYVLPSPKLRLDYFHERDVFSDDPFTDEIEPAVPYSLAVLVQNTGEGTAYNFQIKSAQPRIVENEKGLLIDFKILATEVAGKNLVPSLTANFGDITNHQTTVGRWLMTSTLQGHFVDYSATFEHVNARGETRPSILDQVTIHEMIHLVQAGGTFEDSMPDFLVNDVPDPYGRPDTLWLSDGKALPVSIVEQATHDGAPNSGDLVVHLTATLPEQWSYLRVFDPGNGGFRLSRVERSDGTVIPLGVNVWTTDRTFTGLGRRPTRENILHLLDHHTNTTAEVYTLTYVPLPAVDLTAPSSRVATLPSESTSQIPVAWNGDDNTGGSGLALFDVFVSENRGPFVPWLQQTTLNGAIYAGAHGGTYAFYTVATDRAGNREAAPTTPDATTIVTLSNRPPELPVLADQFVDEGREFTFTVAATDLDLPNDWLTFSLSGAPAGMSINPDTGLIRWLTGEGHGPGTNPVTVIVRDNGLLALSATSVVSVVVREVNTAPTLAPIANRTINEGFALAITNAATDPDRPANWLAYTLGPGAPLGATIDPATGVFSWRPTATQGPSTNQFAVIISDNGTPSLSATQQFTVIVRDSRADFTVSLGSTNLLAGESNAVPIWLNSGLELQSLSFDLDMASPLLTDLALQPVAPEVGSALLLAAGSNRWQLEFTATPGLALQGVMPLAQLHFIAVSNGPSAIVPLDGANLVGEQPGWLLATNSAVFDGRVIVVCREPVLWCERLAWPEATNGGFSLQLYGQPGRDYDLQWSTNMTGSAPWQSWLNLPQTNRVLRLDWPNAGAPALFLRAREEE
ncbi:MAG: hypothetical protein HZA90_27820 [Verrucomicrobia bacterium]|nr:hypothetical protein [Verrucomicrobiota bacterium]